MNGLVLTVLASTVLAVAGLPTSNALLPDARITIGHDTMVRALTSTDRAEAAVITTTHDRPPVTASAWPAVFGWGFAGLSGALVLRRVARSKRDSLPGDETPATGR